MKIEQIENDVFPGYARLKALRAAGQSWFSIDVNLRPEEFVAEDWISEWRDLLGFDQYVIVTADKPR